MELIKINIIRPQIFQAGLHVRRHGLFCQPAALGGQHKLIPDALQGVAQVLLADGVAPGGVDVIDPRLHQLPDESLGPLRIDALDGNAAEAQPGHPQARFAQNTIFHIVSLRFWCVYHYSRFC